MGDHMAAMTTMTTTAPQLPPRAPARGVEMGSIGDGTTTMTATEQPAPPTTAASNCSQGAYGVRDDNGKTMTMTTSRTTGR